MQRCRAVYQISNERQNQGGHRMSAFGVANKGKVAEQFVANQVPGRVDVRVRQVRRKPAKVEIIRGQIQESGANAVPW